VKSSRRPRTAGATPSMHPSMAYARRYENAETIFGTEMGADFLISRVRSFSWEAFTTAWQNWPRW
jgi:hypothetical protein